MIKSIGVAALFLGLAVAPVAAQSEADSLILQYAKLKKVQIAARACTSEEGRMQVARNEHYDTVLRAKTEVAGAPTLSEISAALLETRLEDEALQEKREECELVLDEVVGAARELRRDCVAYPITPATNEEPSRSEAAAIDICRAATGSAAYASANRNPQ
jgi:hypothetical protein